MKAIDRILIIIENSVLGLGFGAMAVVLFAQGVLSKPLGFSWPWAREFALLAMVWVMGAGASVAAREGRHIAVDALVRLLPMRIRIAAAKAACFISSIACAAAMWPCITFVRGAMATGITSQSFGIPMWYMYLALPFTCGLLCLRFALAATDAASRVHKNGGNGGVL